MEIYLLSWPMTLGKIDSGRDAIPRSVWQIPLATTSTRHSSGLISRIETSSSLAFQGTLCSGG